ncbi:MAG: DUF1491 family protein [Alphaproteobacteria bacterium]|nr:DUF1491 family protein [Alphaproteobacteria bacterium]
MSEPRLKSEIWVKAHIRICMVAGAYAVVVRKGDPDAGDILLKLNDLAGGFEVLARATDAKGARVWLRVTGPAPVKEADAEAAIARRLSRDPDLWVIEIEDRARRAFLGDPIADTSLPPGGALR